MRLCMRVRSLHSIQQIRDISITYSVKVEDKFYDKSWAMMFKLENCRVADIDEDFRWKGCNNELPIALRLDICGCDM